VAEGSLAFLGLGQVGVAIRGPGGTLCVDPYLTDNGGGGERLERNYPPPLRPDEVTDASAVLLTHDHIDHTDPETVLPLAAASPGARFFAPFTSRDTLVGAGLDGGRVTHARAGEAFEVAGARVTPVPSAHTELEEDLERGHPYLGYVIEWNGVTVYHAGDTVPYDGLLETLGRWAIDVMFLPINGRDYFRTAQNIVGNTDAREAVEVAEALDVGLVAPTHYDLIPGNTTNPAHFVDLLYRRNPKRPFKLLLPGEIFYHLKP
jgi:L-ascorbate metabolism protein UlaG (beta-lactamase superfamily)